MINPTCSVRRPGWVLAFLAVVLAVVAGLLGAAPASAATASAAQDAVGASTSAGRVAVGSSAGIGAGQRLGNDPPQRQVVVATVVAANTFARSLDDVATLRGATTAEIEGLIPSGWVKSTTNANQGGLGTRYSNPERLGEQIRIMPGKITDPNPLKQGPYLRISRDGTVTDPIPLSGNPTL